MAISTDGLIAHWKMDAIVNGQIADEMGNYPLSAQGDIVDGRFYKALQVNAGQKCTVTLPALPQWTIIGWAKPLSFSEYCHLFSVDNNQGLFALKLAAASYSAGLLYLYKSATGSKTSGLNLTINVWNHYAVTFDGTTLKFYLGGAAGVSLAGAFDMPAATYVFGINNNEDPPCIHDQRRIYNRALSAAEIIDHLNEESPYYVSGQVTQDGSPVSSTLRFYNETTGALVSEVTSDANGAYRFDVYQPDRLYVMALPAAGYRPLVHGPIDPTPR